jgi:methylase of polypeptide subunit release factors
MLARPAPFDSGEMRHDEAVTAAILGARDVDLLRAAVDGYTVDAVSTAIGPVGQAALGRGDLDGLARAVPGDGPLATLVRLFLLGRPVDAGAAGAALHPLPLERAVAAGLVRTSGDSVRALIEVRPYAAGPHDWWVVSDFGSDVRGGPLQPDHVLGIGAASLTLAQATPRTPAGRALDIGTGCGVQALHLGTHAGHVVATDVSYRALQLAATTAALSGQSWELRHGSLLEPARDERFDLVVANPPFVVSDGTGRYDYRDSGLHGDEICRALVTGLPGVLADGGTAQLLANWIIPADRPWQERVGGWLAGRGCDAWVWQREVAEPGEYVAMWLRDAGEAPGTPAWSQQYDAWLDWFAAAGVAAVGMGLITLWRTAAADPVLVLEDVPQPVEQPVGAHLPAWIERQRWLRATSDEQMLAASLAPAPGLVRERSDLIGPDGWAAASTRLRQSHGMRWDIEADDAITALVAGCNGWTSLRAPLQVLAAALGRPLDEVTAAALPVVRDLVARGFLAPAELS